MRREPGGFVGAIDADLAGSYAVLHDVMGWVYRPARDATLRAFSAGEISHAISSLVLHSVKICNGGKTFNELSTLINNYLLVITF